MEIDKILEASSKASPESGSRGNKKIDIEGYEKMLNILAGKEKFEGDIETPEQMQLVIDNIRKFKEETKKKDFKEDPAHALKAKLAKLYPKIGPVQKVLDKIKETGKVTEKDDDVYSEFADEVEDILFYETYYKKHTASDVGGSGGKVNKIVFNHSFPIKYTSDAGKDYYGLVRPPTGAITWQGDRAREVVKNDPEIKIPYKLPILQGTWRIMQTKMMDDILASDRVKIKDDSKAKEKVKEALENAGASINERGDIKGMNKVINSVEFWKDIAKIF